MDDNCLTPRAAGAVALQPVDSDASVSPELGGLTV